MSKINYDYLFGRVNVTRLNKRSETALKRIQNELLIISGDIQLMKTLSAKEQMELVKMSMLCRDILDEYKETKIEELMI